MKKLPMLIACCLAISAQSQASQDRFIHAQSANWAFEEGIRISVKLDPASMTFKSISFQTDGVNLSIPEEELKGLAGPDISQVELLGLAGAEPGGKKWSVKFRYQYRTYEWGVAYHEVRFFFSSTSYLSRETLVPTGKDTWDMASKEKGKPEVQSGHGGQVEGIK